MWTQEEKNELVIRYSDTPIDELIEKFGKSKSSIRQMATRMGLKKKRAVDKSSLNHNCFTAITTESSYWAGFLAADGTIGDNAAIQVKLSGKDHSHLELFNKFIGRDKPVARYTRDTNLGKGFDTSHLQFTSHQMKKDLESIYKLGPRKSLTLEPPTHLWGDIAFSFIKGYIDGDGYICIPKGSNLPRVEILGTKPFLEWINILVNYKWGDLKRNRSPNIRAKTSSSSNNLESKNPVYVYQVGGEQGQALVDYLHTLDTPFLLRRYIDTIADINLSPPPVMGDVKHRELLEGPKDLVATK